MCSVHIELSSRSDPKSLFGVSRRAASYVLCHDEALVMYRRFAFEGDIHASLDCVPLAVRRKLDLAMLKISLEGWQRLRFAERLALCHLPVDSNEEIQVYREVMQAFCERGVVPLKRLVVGTRRGRIRKAAIVPSQAHSR